MVAQYDYYITVGDPVTMDTHEKPQRGREGVRHACKNFL